ncbi:hypothetical protein [Wolbachia endosymbiont of Ctenocephalides felis wCfeJ]|uniref:hypothetical protein n=1 Tax=Wolbachia endosymbiont of Ctenocephalides felis wCfeJ TaxID=2732594 RepID=UPI001444EBFA|nr:hypothetical protein [Wolbachia endosymbiont of Ctenocephalides felis wCfeJ]WCR58540.1 MAG: hypothetical protein PG980_001012 [Wolbachia endosymbiont of Ctenocephalides felis wCfeJ]
MSKNQANEFTNDNNQGPVVAQTAHSSLEDSLKQEIRSLKKEVKSLKAQSRWNSGIIGL